MLNEDNRARNKESVLNQKAITENKVLSNRPTQNEDRVKSKRASSNASIESGDGSATEEINLETITNLFEKVDLKQDGSRSIMERIKKVKNLELITRPFIPDEKKVGGHTELRFEVGSSQHFTVNGEYGDTYIKAFKEAKEKKDKVKYYVEVEINLNYYEILSHYDKKAKPNGASNEVLKETKTGILMEALAHEMYVHVDPIIDILNAEDGGAVASLFNKDHYNFVTGEDELRKKMLFFTLAWFDCGGSKDAIESYLKTYENDIVGYSQKETTGLGKSNALTPWIAFESYYRVEALITLFKDLYDQENKDETGKSIEKKIIEENPKAPKPEFQG